MSTIGNEFAGLQRALKFGHRIVPRAFGDQQREREYDDREQSRRHRAEGAQIALTQHHVGARQRHRHVECIAL
jgi:hypothetical protein